jgi:hypothetical protein
MTALGKLDVHAHSLPESYRQALERAGHAQPDGMPQIPEWSAEAHVALMDRLEIATSRRASTGDPPGALTEALRANTERLFPRLAEHR